MLFRKLRHLCRDERGGILAYTAILGVVGLGAGGAAMDFARLELLKSEIQHAADAAATAGASRLVGGGARTVAEDVARNAVSNASNVPGANSVLTVTNVRFYATYDPDPRVEATTDQEARFIEVTMSPQTVSLLFAPVLNMFSSGIGSVTLNGRAVAVAKPYICNVPPIMMCDPLESLGIDPTQSVNFGRMLKLGSGPDSGTWAPGNFGLLTPPDGNSSDIDDIVASEVPPSCYQGTVETATGSHGGTLINALNVRFDLRPTNRTEPPAPNVINMPRDSDVIADPNLVIGNGDWDRDGYWTTRHGGALPADLADASRYQVYLYETGVPYLRNGLQTIYPVPADPSSYLSAGFVLVTPPSANLAVAATPAADSDGDGIDDGDDPDQDGVPQNAPSDPTRRILKVALIDCLAQSVTGSGTYQTNGKYVKLFMTEEALPGPVVYTEIVAPITASDPSYHVNVSLVD